MENGLEIEVEIVLEDLNSTTTEVLLFPSGTASLEDVKTRIEECYSIPACVQKMCENILSVFCPREGDVAEVKSAIDWLKQCVEILEGLLGKCAKENATLPKNSEDTLWNKRNSDLIKNLFSYWLNPSTEVNCSHFNSLGGVDLLVKLHKILIQLRQSSNQKLGNASFYLEWLCCKVICGFCCNNEMAKLMADSGALGGCIESLLIKTCCDEGVLDDDQSFQTVVMALCAICK